MPDEELRTAKIRILKQADFHRCPHVIMVGEHYREDGTCRCDDPKESIMAEWGYEWNGVAWITPEEE